MPWWDTSTGHAYGLTVAGVQVIDHVPLDEVPIRWEETGPDAVGTLSFLVEDTGTIGLEDGAEVRLTDNVNGRTLFGGVLLERRVHRGPGSTTFTECEVASYDWFLDNRIVPRFESKRNVGNRIRKMTHDRAILKYLIQRRGGPIEAKNANVDLTNTDMDFIKLSGETLRSALETIADEASPGDGENAVNALGRHFYVDFDRQLHYFKGTEGLVAPYRISDTDYTTVIRGHADLREYWSLREERGGTNYGLNGNDLTLAGTRTQGVTDVGVVGMPHYRAVTLDGSTSYTSNGSYAATLGDD